MLGLNACLQASDHVCYKVQRVPKSKKGQKQQPTLGPELICPNASPVLQGLRHQDRNCNLGHCPNVRFFPRN